MPNTLQQFSRFNLTYDKVSDCQNLRLMSLDWEKQTCFKYSRYLFIAFIFSFLCLLTLLIASWMLCCALRGNAETQEKKRIHERVPTITTEDYEIECFEENEKIPVF